MIVAAIPHKRKVTPEQFAGELERHLLGTEKQWDWDDTTSVAIADERLERIRSEISRFTSFSSEKDKDELRAIIAALRRGEIPEIVPPTHLKDFLKTCRSYARLRLSPKGHGEMARKDLQGSLDLTHG